MEVQIEDIGPNRKRLNVTVSTGRIKSHIDKVYRAASGQVRMKGYRPGKIPRHILEARLGDSLLAQAKESLIEETFREAMESNELQLIGSPKLDIASEPLAADEALSYSVDIDLKPEATIGDIASIEVQRRSIEATDDELQQSLEDLAKARRKLSTVDDALGDGDFAKVDMLYLLDGEEISKKQGLQINTRIPVLGTDAEEFRAKLTGLEKGETAVLPISYPDTFEKEGARGKQGDIRISINEVLRFVPPPLDDEFARSFDYPSMEKLQESLRAKIKEEKERVENLRIEEEILDTLYTENPFDVPEGIIEEETKHRLEHLSEEMKRGGVPEQEIPAKVDELRPRVEQEARNGVRNHFLIDALGRKKKIFVTESDVQNEIRQIASANEENVKEVRKHFEENNLFPSLRLELLHRKVREFLRETAKMTDSDDAP
ncbi:MAG: trigger factor [Planctomycetota bacterium]